MRWRSIIQLLKEMKNHPLQLREYTDRLHSIPIVILIFIHSPSLGSMIFQNANKAVEQGLLISIWKFDCAQEKLLSRVMKSDG